MHDADIHRVNDRASRPVVLFVLVGLALAWGYQAIPKDSIVRPVALMAISIATAVSIFRGVRAHRPSRRLGWYFLLAGQCSQIAGDAIWRLLPALTKVEFGYPNPSDAFYLFGYGLYVVALGLIVRDRSERDRANFIDASVFTVGVAMLTWIFVIGPTARDATAPLTARLVSSAYPLLDVLIIAVLIRFALSSTKRTPSARLLIAAASATLVADVSFALLSTFQTSGLFESGWLSAYVFLGASALHPSMSDEVRMNSGPVAPLGIRRLVLVTIAALTAPGVLVVQWASGSEIDVPVIACGASLMFLLVLARMEHLVSRLRRGESERRRLLERVMHAAESERARIASELHDSPIQRMSGVNLRLATVEQRIKRGASGDAIALLQSAQLDLSKEVDVLRRLMSMLRPPSLDHIGLRGALEDHAATALKDTMYAIDVQLAHRLPVAVEEAMFRVAKEAVLNSATHSACSQVRIIVCDTNDGAELVVTDDGIGFDGRHRPGGLGLATVSQDAEMHSGRVEIRSAHGKGTTVRASFMFDRSAA
jgi:signal transduction histidine kinase